MFLEVEYSLNHMNIFFTIIIVIKKIVILNLHPQQLKFDLHTLFSYVISQCNEMCTFLNKYVYIVVQKYIKGSKSWLQK